MLPGPACVSAADDLSSVDSPESSPTAGEARALELDELINISLRENPRIRRLAKMIEARQHAVSPAGTLPDPMVGLEFSSLPVGSLALDETPMSGIQIIARQRVPYPGKLRLRQEVAAHQVDTTEAEYWQTVAEVIAEVKKAYLDYYYVNQSILATLENQKLLEAFADISDARLESGMGLLQDSLKARLEVARLLDELIQLRQLQDSTAARINLLLDRPPDAPLGKPAVVERHQVDHQVDDLLELAVRSSPRLSRLRAEISRYEAARELAIKELKPDFEFGVGYRIRSNTPMDAVGGRDFWSFSVMMTLPVFAGDKQKEQIREQEATLEATQAAFQAERSRLFFEIRNHLSRIRQTQQQIELYSTGIIPQAEMVLESALADYQTGQVDFLSILNSQSTLYTYQLAYYQALTEHEKAIAELEQTLGTRLY